MPRLKIKPASRIDGLSVLDEKGELDATLEPRIEQETLRRLFETMLLARRFDERMLKLQRSGRIGTFAPVKGQEASQLGAASALGDDDWIVPSYRDTAAALWLGVPLEGLLLYNAGYNEGGRIPDGINMLPIAIPVGTQMLHAVGIAMGLRRQRKEGVVMTFFGDGATSEGDFHEAMNFASVFDAPVVFLCQNNQYAISVPRNRQTRAATLAQKAVAYDMPGIQVDGNDLLAVHVAAAEAVERARTEHRPTLIECVTYRLEVHTTADDPTRYREDEEVERWRERDPLPRFQRYLEQKGVLDEAGVQAIEAEVDERVEKAWAQAQEAIEEAKKSPEVVFDHLLAELPPGLEAQRELFVRRAKAGRQEPLDEPPGESQAEQETVRKDEEETADA